VAFPFYPQHDQMDCGPACLRMLAKYYGKNVSLQYLRNQMHLSRTGVSMLSISHAAEKIGFRTMSSAKVKWDDLVDKVPFPCLLFWDEKHYVILYKIKNNIAYIADPAHELVKLNKQEFIKSFYNKESESGLVMALEPTPEFFKNDFGEEQKRSLAYLFNYLKPYKQLMIQLAIGLLVASLFDLLMPFLTQSMVDKGINYQNIGFVNLILLAQVMIFFSRIAIEMVRNRILLHVGFRVNIALISDYLYKIMQLPVPFFESKMIGDITQRILDHKRIENFLTQTSLQTIFSLFNLVIFALVLSVFSWKIVLLFLLGSALSIGWILAFQKRMKNLDYVMFKRQAMHQSNLVELLTGMPEIKLNGTEKQKRWDWERIQIQMFQIKMKMLNTSQLQQAGSGFFNQFRNLIITYVAARLVIEGQISLGTMMAISYIIGQMSAPIERLLDFFRSLQDAQISIDRLSEVNNMKNEVDESIQVINELPKDKTIHLQNLSFGYEGPNHTQVLKDISLHIPAGKVTAIVGTSGSGKTTLLKLLLKFYEPIAGEIVVGDVSLHSINSEIWRNKIGAVMQDGFIFTDTITKNIAGSDDDVDAEKLIQAVKIANIDAFIKVLPNGFATKIGNGGTGLSMGQKQRMLIARAVYKNPDYLFFDEATSSLDANNEKYIMQHLKEFYKNRTVLIVAHRLSTVKEADQILVMEDGKIVEQGNHKSLTEAQGKYFELVKNQLELGK
jgi:ATP-binding cassette subfamily B protein